MNPELLSSVEHPAPTTLVSPEWSLLCAASSADPRESDLVRVRTVLERPIEWESVLRLAEQHGTSSLLYQNLARLAGAIPPAVLTSLRQRYERNVHKSLFLTRELIRILDCLDAIGVEVIPYKGVVLSEVYYGDMAMRQSGDMDLFVRKRDVARTKSAVRDLGFTPRVPIPEDAEADYIASGYECTFDSPAGKNLLELQWALQPRFYAVDFEMDGLFERAVNVALAGRSVRTPSPEDLLLVLSVHAAKHVWGRLIWLCDIAQILKRENVNWKWVQSQAQELGIERILHITLLLANRLLATAIPAPLETAILQDRAAQAFADEISLAVAAGATYEEEKLSYFRLMMRLRERRVDRWRFLARLTFTPGPGEWETVRLPKVLFPLYRLVRLARLASRFVRG
ncbi:MAG: nucleotidyltransferase family protein [Candidatus Sulfotelmatobacter sp.]